MKINGKNRERSIQPEISHSLYSLIHILKMNGINRKRPPVPSSQKPSSLPKISCNHIRTDCKIERSKPNCCKALLFRKAFQFISTFLRLHIASKCYPPPKKSKREDRRQKETCLCFFDRVLQHKTIQSHYGGKEKHVKNTI